MEVHKALGPGLLESAYEECLCHELGLRELAFERQRPLPVAYKGVRLDCGYRVDIVVEGKSSDWERPCYQQALPMSPHTCYPCSRSEHGERAGVRGIFVCLRLGGLEVGLPINFHVAALKQGLRRKAL